MNSIEEYQNLVSLLEQALKFYANKQNYVSNTSSNSLIASDDYGSQARFALRKIEELNNINTQMENDFIKLSESTDGDTTNSELLRAINGINNIGK